jgi:hypothetical protein
MMLEMSIVDVDKVDPPALLGDSTGPKNNAQYKLEFKEI